MFSVNIDFPYPDMFYVDHLSTLCNMYCPSQND